MRADRVAVLVVALGVHMGTLMLDSRDAAHVDAEGAEIERRREDAIRMQSSPEQRTKLAMV